MRNHKDGSPKNATGDFSAHFHPLSAHLFERADWQWEQAMSTARKFCL